MLSNGLILLLGSWAAAYTLTNDTDDIIGFYDRVMKDVYPDNGTTEDVRDSIGAGDLIYDLIMHTLKGIVVVIMGAAEAGMAWVYVYYQFSDEPYAL